MAKAKADIKTSLHVTPLERSSKPIDPGVEIGHVHLRTADIDRVHGFYVGILGFDVIFRMRDALFLSAGGYHHHLGFNTWESKGGNPPRQAPPAFTTWPSVIRREPRSATRFAGSSPPIGRWMASTTTAPTKPFT